MNKHQIKNLSAGGGLPPVQQVFCQAKQSGSHPLRHREGRHVIRFHPDLVMCSRDFHVIFCIDA